MIQYMLDTNICIYLMKRRPPEVVERFIQYRKGEIVLSAVTWGELCCGMEEGHEISRDHFQQWIDIVDFDRAAGEQFGILSRQYPQRKRSFDRMLAAHALALDVTLVTNNVADFRLYRPAGLKMENWVADTLQ